MNRTVYRRAPGPVPDSPQNLRLVDDRDDAALAVLMERAYAGTIDEHLGGNSDGAVEIAGWRQNAVPRASFVVLREGRIAAASLISLNDKDFWLAYVITHPEWKGHGLGTAVVAASLRALDAPVFAGVTDGNTPSERLLTTLGFTPVPR
ncbi:Acetyltransferase (GNAT) domain-containing protein [Lentzea waywayandensis]|uniref:Acetyltransferase (GNAT) domain-containing protein n=1 Tax=Lentzea waywayandensis TaxID=84724 RepID=A0A1I6FIV0_9PSEU|nr:GNAT family N-acetyltransferase [Lentzea waywayandensis]SFR29860.1 Acetyltransferase (GNAT) domain-containing protein [Lentzea waywayandensis]